MQKTITISDVKKALKDERFRDILPKNMEREIISFLDNPSCACHLPLYRRILKECGSQLSKYYPGMEVPDKDEEIIKMAENHWMVINCHIDELENRLKKLGPGRKQIDVARYQDQVTVVVNDLDIIF
jgi:hypothetical protein